MKKKPTHWEAYSRDRAYGLVSWLRRQGHEINEPAANAIRIWLHQENRMGYRRAKKASR